MVRHCSCFDAITMLVAVTVAVGHAQELTIEDLRVKANQGDAEAKYSLGLRYANGEGVPQDYAQARPLFERAALQGYAPAEYNLGVLYADGLGGPQDYGEAATLYRLAADQGNAEAQFNLGTMYANGQGVTQDYVHAYMWFGLVASGTTGESRELAVRRRDAVATRMTADEVAEAQRVTAAFTPRELLI